MNSYNSEELKQSPISVNARSQREEVALNYRRNRLQQKAWKSLMLEYVLSSLPYRTIRNMQETVMEKMCANHYFKSLVKRTFRSFIINTQSCLIDKLERAKGEEIFKIRVFRKAFTAWKSLIYEKKIEDYRVREIKQKLDYKKKVILMRRWME